MAEIIRNPDGGMGADWPLDVSNSFQVFMAAFLLDKPDYKMPVSAERMRFIVEWRDRLFFQVGQNPVTGVTEVALVIREKPQQVDIVIARN